MKLEDLEQLAQKSLKRWNLLKIGVPSFTVISPNRMIKELIPGVSPKVLGQNTKGYVLLINAEEFLSALKRYRMEFTPKETQQP